MNVDVGIGEDRLLDGLPAQMEPGLTESRPPSVASSDARDSHCDNEDYAGGLWDEIEVLLQAQEDDLIEQYEATPTGVLFDTPTAPIVKRPSIPTSPTLSFQHQSAVSSLVSGPSPSPSVSPLKPLLHPSSPMRHIVTDLKGECQPDVSPLHPHVLLPSQGASVAGQSARTEPARESPSRWFFACPDQIEALGTPMTWVHGQVISTLGDTFCHTSHSKPKHECYEMLPTNLFDLWTSSMAGDIVSRTCLSSHFKHTKDPTECRAWLIPVLLEYHWYLLEFDWIDCVVRILDSLAMNRSDLVDFGSGLLNLIAEDCNLTHRSWNVIPEQVSSFHGSLTRF